MNNQNDNDYISPAELYAQFDGPETPLIIDVRGADEFAAGHILGAIHIPADELNERLDEIPINRSLVPYWNMRHRGSSRSERAAQLLRESSYHAQALEGGYPAWDDAGYPTEKE